MAGYTRQSTYTDGDVINAADSNDEFDQLLAAFNNSTGHKHDGTAAEGPVIGLIGDPGITTPLNKVVIDNPNNQIEFSVDVASSSTEQFVVKDGVIEPTTDDDIDLGSSGKEFKDLYIDGVAYLDSIAMPTTTVTDILDEDAMTSDSATALATQQSIKAYVDAQVTAQDLDFQADTGGALNIDLDSETLTLTGGTGIDSTASGNGVTFAIDSTVATLVGSQTLTNKTIDVDNNTVSNIEVDNLKSGVLDTDLTSVAATDTTIASAKAIKTYVDAQVTAQDLDFAGDTGGALSIDLDSESLTIAGGTGIDTVGASNTLTVAIDSTVATLTGTQTLTNKTLTSPVLNTGVSGTAFLDDDTFATASATTLASSESIKAYVDAQILTEDTLAELNDTNITSPADGALLFYDTGTSMWIDNVVSGDITIADTGVAAISSGVIVNDDINASAAISISKTALVGGTGLTLTGDTLSVDAAQTQITSVGTLDSLTVSGDLTIDTSTLVVDSTNNRVGILDATPAVTLDVGTATDAIFVPKGTTAQRPTGVDGYFRYNTTDAQFEGYADGAWGAIAGGGGAVAPPNGTSVEALTLGSTTINEATILQDADSDTRVQVEESADEDKIRFDTGGTERAVIDSTGLSVTGTINASTDVQINGSSA